MEHEITSHLAQNLKRLRQSRGLTMDALAKRSGVSKAMLSQIEARRTNPTVAVVWKIAAGLGIDLVDLIGGSKARASVEVLRRRDHPVMANLGRRCRIRVLSPLSLDKDLEFYELAFGAAGYLRSEPHFRGTQELLACTQGTLEVKSHGEAQTLESGDSALYRVDVKHEINNVGKGEAGAFLIVKYRQG